MAVLGQEQQWVTVQQKTFTKWSVQVRFEILGSLLTNFSGLIQKSAHEMSLSTTL